MANLEYLNFWFRPDLTFTFSNSHSSKKLSSHHSKFHHPSDHCPSPSTSLLTKPSHNPRPRHQIAPPLPSPSPPSSPSILPRPSSPTHQSPVLGRTGLYVLCCRSWSRGPQQTCPDKATREPTSSWSWESGHSLAALVWFVSGWEATACGRGSFGEG